MTKATSRSTFERLLAELIELASNPNLNMVKLATRLEVSHRTVVRDFEFLRSRLLVPLEYNASELRWTITSPDAVQRIQSIKSVFANLA